MIIWVGAGLAGLIGLANTTTFNAAPAVLRALEITAIVVGAAFFSSARVKFEWEATLIKRGICDRSFEANDVLPLDKAWPRDAEECWKSGFFCILSAGLIMLTCFWWQVNWRF